MEKSPAARLVPSLSLSLSLSYHTHSYSRWERKLWRTHGIARGNPRTTLANHLSCIPAPGWKVTALYDFPMVYRIGKRYQWKMCNYLIYNSALVISLLQPHWLHPGQFICLCLQMQKTNALQWKKNLISCKKIYEDAKKCFFFLITNQLVILSCFPRVTALSLFKKFEI